MSVHDEVPAPAQAPRKLTVKEAAERAGVSESLVYDWCGRGLLTHYRFGAEGKRGKVMIEPAALDAFLASCRKEARPEAPPTALKHIRANHG